MKAIVTASICPLLGKPTRQSTLEDEALYGMVVELLESPAPGWQRVRTHYRYEGIVSEEDLLMDDDAAAAWEKLPKKISRSPGFRAGSSPPCPGAACSAPPESRKGAGFPFVCLTAAPATYRRGSWRTAPGRR